MVEAQETISLPSSFLRAKSFNLKEYYSKIIKSHCSYDNVQLASESQALAIGGACLGFRWLAQHSIILHHFRPPGHSFFDTLVPNRTQRITEQQATIRDIAEFHHVLDTFCYTQKLYSYVSSSIVHSLVYRCQQTLFDMYTFNFACNKLHSILNSWEFETTCT